MAGLRLTGQADLAVFYEADAQQYAAGSAALQVVSKEAFVAFFAGCPSVGFEMDGKPIGGLLFDGTSAHIAVLPAYHGRWALLLKPALAWLFSLQQEVIVHVEAHNHTCQRFLARHHWERLYEEDGTVAYRVTPQGGTRKTAYPFGPGAKPASQVKTSLLATQSGRDPPPTE
jgi:GNAT superfamily N-acetyltransferase